MNHEYASEDTSSTASDNVSKSHAKAIKLEEDKGLIRSHPLFPLLELLFDKCERATRGEETPSSSAYDDDIQEFVRHHEAMRSRIYIDQPEVDNLMIKAVQVLRIHLLELEKVNELCKDFCNRYITCLKGKMHSENLLRSEIGSYSTDIQSHQPMISSHLMANTPNSNVTVTQQGELVIQGNNYHHNDTYSQPSESNGIDGSTPISQIGASPNNQGVSRLCNSHPYPPEESGPVRKTKRGVLPKQATEILRSWLFSHIVHAYPTEDEKRQLASQTNLTLLQVNNWFINARRRILQPMLDASNPDANGGIASNNAIIKSKKSKPQRNRSTTDRFWQHSVTSSTPDENLTTGK